MISYWWLVGVGAYCFMAGMDFALGGITGSSNTITLKDIIRSILWPIGIISIFLQ